MAKEKNKKKRKCIAMMYSFSENRSNTVFKQAIIFKNRETAIVYLNKKGYEREDTIKKYKKYSKNKPDKEKLFINEDDKRIVGLLDSIVYNEKVK